MPSFRITIAPSRRAGARHVAVVRRELQKALAEEAKVSGLTQSEIARRIDVHRSVINRELRGTKDMTLGRVGELAWAMGRKAQFSLPKVARPVGANLPPPNPAAHQPSGTSTGAVLESSPASPASTADAFKTIFEFA